VEVLHRPRFVDESRCTACGVCASYCPVAVPDPYDENLKTRKAVYIPYTQAAPAVFAVDPDHCLFLTRKECKQCTRTCQAEAIDFDQKPQVLTYDVGAVILAPGFSSYDPSRLPEFRYANAKNVVTGKEFERVCCASGPYMGDIRRPSDLSKPKRIAMLLCIGSRDKGRGNPYCSAVCCKFAVKDAIVALEHEPDLDITIFYMDMRMYGKGFETFRQRAKAAGVKFVRARVAGICEDTLSHDLTLRYVPENGNLKEESFNLVLLANGLEAPLGAGNLAVASHIGLNEYGFCQTDLFAPASTTRKGVFVAGAFQGPKSIPESVCQAGAAAASAAELLAPARGTLAASKTYPEERSAPNGAPKIGVFVCHCGKNIAGVVDVEEVAKYAQSLDDVAMVERNLYSCSSDTQALISRTIADQGLNRVVVAACTPRTHEVLFQETLREAGLNKCLVEMVNIRDQCSWVHMHEKQEATQKAKDLIRMAVAKARRIEPLSDSVIEVNPKGLVIGGGLSGMTAALSLAEQGFRCYLVERRPELGGNLARTYYTLEGPNPQEHLKALSKKIQAHEGIEVFADTTIESVEGFVGNFKTTLCSADGRKTHIEHGTIIVATGARPYEPEQYLYGQHDRVVLQEDLEQQIGRGRLDPSELKQVAMIQCVGSRDEAHPYCSAVCCNQALNNALKIKALSPETNVTILYRDVMSYGFREAFYSKAKERGVVFVRYRAERKPEVESADGALRLRFEDAMMRREVIMEPDLLALSTAKVPYENQALVEHLKIPLSSDGFFLESHAQLKPVDAYVDGIYLCGNAVFPKPPDECIAQAKAAAVKAAILMAKGYVTVEPIVASCDTGVCIGCGICAHLCPYGAIRMTKIGKAKKAEFVSAICKGCGICAAYCPVRAITMGRFTDDQIAEQIAAFGAEMCNDKEQG